MNSFYDEYNHDQTQTNPFDPLLYDQVADWIEHLSPVTARKDDAAAADQAATAKVAVSMSAGCDGGLIQTTPG